MNTSDLRDTLASHAAFEDDGLSARVVGVRQRVRVVRRRRRAAVGGAVAAVLAIGAAGVAIPKLTNEAAPASRDLAGHTAPATLESLDAVYAFKRGVEGIDKVTLNLPKSDEARLVTWATASDDDRVSVRRSGETLQSSRPDFTDFTVIHRGAERVVLEGSGRIAAAVYTLSRPAPGLTKNGIYLPGRRGGGELLAAGIGDPGEKELTATIVVPKTGIEKRVTCTAPKGYIAHLTLNGRHTLTSECDDLAGDFSESSYGSHEYAGEKVTYRMWLAKGPFHGKPAPLTSDEVPDAQLTFGLYSVGPVTGTSRFYNTIDGDGHRWRLVAHRAGGRDNKLDLDATDGPKYVAWSVSGVGGGTYGLLVDGKLRQSWIGGDGGSSTTVYAGRHTLTIGGKTKFKPSSRIDYAVYERID